jgi:hypothetical protein
MKSSAMHTIRFVNLEYFTVGYLLIQMKTSLRDRPRAYKLFGVTGIPMGERGMEFRQPDLENYLMKAAKWKFNERSITDAIFRLVLCASHFFLNSYPDLSNQFNFIIINNQTLKNKKSRSNYSSNIWLNNGLKTTFRVVSILVTITFCYQLSTQSCGTNLTGQALPSS